MGPSFDNTHRLTNMPLEILEIIYSYVFGVDEYIIGWPSSRSINENYDESLSKTLTRSLSAPSPWTLQEARSAQLLATCRHIYTTGQPVLMAQTQFTVFERRDIEDFLLREHNPKGFTWYGKIQYLKWWISELDLINIVNAKGRPDLLDCEWPPQLRELTCSMSVFDYELHRYNVEDVEEVYYNIVEYAEPFIYEMFKLRRDVVVRNVSIEPEFVVFIYSIRGKLRRKF